MWLHRRGLRRAAQKHCRRLSDGRVVERAPDYDLDGQPADAEERLAEKLLIMWTADTRFVVDQLYRLNAADRSGRFTGRLDLDRLGMVGHSLGGATALQFCHEDSRCKAGINVDGIPFGSVIREGLSQPFLFLVEGGDFSPARRAHKRDSDADVFFSRVASIYLIAPPRTESRAACAIPTSAAAASSVICDSISERC
jgi:pimeloyl-ACP methyl ester carboxylesterase